MYKVNVSRLRYITYFETAIPIQCMLI